MSADIRDMSASELRIFAEIISRLERIDAQSDVRAAVVPDLVKLLRIDIPARSRHAFIRGGFELSGPSAEADFSHRETVLLDVLAPFIQRALARQASRADDLTDREREVSALVAKGCRDREIGAMLGISFSTVRTHISRALKKKYCANRAELAAAVTSN